MLLLVFGADALPARTAALLPPAATTAAETTLGFGPGFIHIQRPPVELRAVEPAHRILSFLAVGHLNEPETTRLARVTVCENRGALNSAVGGEELKKLLLCSLETKVSDKYLHTWCPLRDRDRLCRTALEPTE